MRMRSSILKSGSNSNEAPAQWKRSRRIFIARPSTASASFSRPSRFAFEDESREVLAGREALGEKLVNRRLGQDLAARQVDAETLVRQGGGHEDDRATLEVDRAQDLPAPDRHAAGEGVDLQPLKKIGERKGVEVSAERACHVCASLTRSRPARRISASRAQEARGLLEREELAGVLLEDADAVAFLRDESDIADPWNGSPSGCGPCGSTRSRRRLRCPRA